MSRHTLCAPIHITCRTRSQKLHYHGMAILISEVPQVLFRLSGRENLESSKNGQDAKDRVVRLVEDRILAQILSLHKACKIVDPALGFRGTQQDNGRRPFDSTEESVNTCRKTRQLKMPGYGEKTTSYATQTSR